MLRTWVLPSLTMVLENNTHRAYPQDLAEIGHGRRSRRLGEHRRRRTPHVAAALARTDASYEDAKARLQALADAFDKDLETPPTTHPSFIGGRAAEVVSTASRSASSARFIRKCLSYTIWSCRSQHSSSGWTRWRKSG